MADTAHSNPNPISPPPPPAASPPSPAAPPPHPPRGFIPRRVPELRVTSEFDSESSLFFHKVSCKFFDRVAKLRLCFKNDNNGWISSPQIGFLTKNISVLYDVESQNALLKGSFDLTDALQIRVAHDVKEKQGHVAMITSWLDPSHKFELSSSIPPVGLPKATLSFPRGRISFEEKYNEAASKGLSINGIFKGELMNGVCTAAYKANDLNIRYLYKDEEVSIIPSISLPSSALSFAFKRRFSPSDKLSYWYQFNSNTWSAVYKHTVGKDLKFKAGYDSDIRLGWAFIWIGDEGGKAKTAPMKIKVQLMAQVSQDDPRNTVFMFRVKKRWDF